MHRSSTQPTGSLTLNVKRAVRLWTPGHELSNEEILAQGLPVPGAPREINEWREAQAPRHEQLVNTLGVARSVAREHGLAYMWSQLWLRVKRAGEPIQAYGLAGCRMLTDDGVAFIVDTFAGSPQPETMKYHALGTTNTGEAQGDSALVAEITTQYATDNIRATGTTAEGASAFIYQTVATNTVDGAVAAVEHGVLDQASNAGGVLLDRTVFTVINLGSGDGLESTYELSFIAGS